MKQTQWYPGTIKPVRVGVYKQRNDARVGYQFWDLKRWHAWCETPEQAALATTIAHDSFQNDPWRGLQKFLA